ncbi:MAG: phycobilisome rod-core linker polypeptide, partial [Cyanobacteria bacterium P01_H01_bin.153]
MTSTTSARLLGFEPFVQSAPIELRTKPTEADIQAVIWATYRQVFGNDHLMQSERLISAESMLKQGYIRVRDF